jgi:uncharacterized protein (TIGR01777 family)
MIVLITGATGFIGRALMARLAAEGHDLRVLTRNPEATQPRLPARARAFAWTSGGPVPDEAMHGADAVIHLAGENVGQWPWTRARKRRILESRVHGTRRLVEAMGRVERKPAVFVAASGAGYYGDAGEQRLDESAPPGRGFLAEVCVAWEREIFRAEELGVRTVAIRSGMVLGRGGALAKLLPVFRLGLGAVLGSGRQWLGWSHVEDTAGIFMHALSAQAMRGPVNGTAPEAVRQEEFARALAAALRRPLLFRIPAFALRLGLGEMAGALLDSQRADGKKLAEMGYAFRYPRIGLALGNITTGGGNGA